MQKKKIFVFFMLACLIISTMCLAEKPTFEDVITSSGKTYGIISVKQTGDWQYCNDAKHGRKWEGRYSAADNTYTTVIKWEYGSHSRTTKLNESKQRVTELKNGRRAIVEHTITTYFCGVCNHGFKVATSKLIRYIN